MCLDPRGLRQFISLHVEKTKLNKAYLLISGYPEENIDKKFIKFALSNKRKNILQNKRKQKSHL